MGQLPTIMNKPATTLERLLKEHVAPDLVECEEEEEDQEVEDDESDGMSDFSEEERVEAQREANEKSVPQGKLQLSSDLADDSVLFHPRFAAGQVFTPELWGVMLGRMYHMPAVIEIVEG